jgi:hypothetical protein
MIGLSYLELAYHSLGIFSIHRSEVLTSEVKWKTSEVKKVNHK